MADLDDKNSAGTVKLTGADTSGLETNYLDVDSDGQLTSKLADSNGDLLTSTLDAGKQALDVNIINSLTTTSGAPDKDPFTYGTTSQQTIGGVFQDTSPTLTAGQSGASRLTAERGLHTNLRNSTGTEIATAGAPLRTDPTGTTTQPISGSVTANAGTNLNTSALALDSTVAKDSSLATLDASVNTLLKPASTLAAVTSITNTVTIKADTAGNQANALKVDGSATTQPVSAASLPLPTGASTSALQTTGNSSLSSIDTKVPSGLTVTSTRLLTDGSGVTQPISAASLPLPSGASTLAEQQTQTTSLQLIDDLPHLDGDSITSAKGIGIFGSDGTNFQWLKVDAFGGLSVSITPTANTFFSFGDVTTASLALAVVRRTVYTEPAANAQRSMSSNNANDTSAGTGARTVKITYITTTGTGPFTETITLNGTTAVNTVATDIRFIESMEVITCGSTGSNVGIITLFGSTAGGGGTVGTIAATNNRTFWAHHYIPVSKTFKLTGISCSHNGTTVGSGALFFLRSLPINISNVPEIQVSDFVRLYGQSSTFARTYNSPILIPGPARVIMYVTPESASSFTYRAAFDFFEE